MSERVSYNGRVYASSPEQGLLFLVRVGGTRFIAQTRLTADMCVSLVEERAELCVEGIESVGLPFLNNATVVCRFGQKKHADEEPLTRQDVREMIGEAFLQYAHECKRS